LETRDSNRIAILFQGGGSAAVPLSEIINIMKMYYPRSHRDSAHMHGIDLLHYERFKSYLAPSFMAGATLPTKNSNASGDFAFSAGAMLAFEIPGFLYNYVGEFAAASMESRSFGLSNAGIENSFTVRYFALTPGISFRGLVSLGVTLGLPVSAHLVSYVSDIATPQSINTNAVHLLVEPRVIIGVPVSYTASNEQAVMLTAEAGYPLGPIFNKSTLTFSSDGVTSTALSVGNLRLPEISIGLSYVFPLVNIRAYSRY
jgi:hypothetical protein